ICDSDELKTKELKKYGDEVIGICKRYITYLEKYESWNISIPENHMCTLLNYWFYNALVNILGSDNYSTIVQAFGTLLRRWSHIDDKELSKSLKNKCGYYFKLPPKDDWQKRKELYEYYLDYTTIKSLSSDISKCESYYEYIQKKAELYEHFEKVCLPRTSNCPDFYDECMPYKPDNVLSSFPCYDEMQKQQHAAKSPKILNNLTHTLQPENGIVTAGLQASAETIQHTQSTSESSDIRTKISDSILGTAPVLLTATMLYRVCIYFVNIYHYSTSM
ncbi:CYIR protein, partial [Plasmodium cynomolgi strain B]